MQRTTTRPSAQVLVVVVAAVVFVTCFSRLPTTESFAPTTLTPSLFRGEVSSLSTTTTRIYSYDKRQQPQRQHRYDDGRTLSTAATAPAVTKGTTLNSSSWTSAMGALCLGMTLALNVLFVGMAGAAEQQQSYDGFAEYAKENQMQQSDVGCFVEKCGEQTKNLFSNPRGIKGVSCLGRCKGEQSCATRCFAEFGSENLNDWLSCTIEENECVKVPKNIDNSAENFGYSMAVKAFNPASLVDGTPWYKTDGLNPNYDLFDCQTNTFQVAQDSSNGKELDMGIFFRVKRPEGGFWENSLTERMVVDASSSPQTMGGPDVVNAVEENDLNPTGRTLHTSGKMYGLKFSENWYILGESDGKNNVPPFKLVAYKGHTLQGNYEGAFVYAKEPILPEAAKPAVRQAAARAGLDFDKFTPIDNSCPAGIALNDADAGTGTSSTDWVDLVVGEGGVIDWISPGWRGEYNNKKM